MTTNEFLPSDKVSYTLAHLPWRPSQSKRCHTYNKNIRTL